MTGDFFVYFYVKSNGSSGMLEHAKQSVTEQLKLPGDVMPVSYTHLHRYHRTVHPWFRRTESHPRWWFRAGHRLSLIHISSVTVSGTVSRSIAVSGVSTAPLFSQLRRTKNAIRTQTRLTPRNKNKQILYFFMENPSKYSICLFFWFYTVLTLSLIHILLLP